ncbi:MAG: hypothetical protein F6K25_02085 [Okeania sp. SIO2G4]|uniref:hypothetical protein n=1 Tax=unclassified Okeania TaxID=2634635 RepID=UPI0013BD8C9B|nr:MULTISPECIES: hypothetical protein [unclassified Okeania]NEP03443.1 hypothetical protein [Okeania sp. SIO4D6]NEP71674.1 hypothetical protein [Okeania sp. SIO2G5]NEP91769.1 hypothetical protein [Okeania sp. SIO2F5]NEQ89596.1 hypothetical protein [Okeania sp. SIO2G4]
MSNYKITLQPVYSETVSIPKEVKSPPNLSIYIKQKLLKHYAILILMLFLLVI